MIDTRTTLRYAVDLPGRMKIAEIELSCRIRNLSRGGVFVAGPAIMLDTRVGLKFSAPHLELLEVTCVSRWHNHEGSGLSFDGLRPIDAYMLAKFIRHASRSTQRLPTDAILRPPASER